MWKSVEIVRFGWNCANQSKLWKSVEIVKIYCYEILLKLWNFIKLWTSTETVKIGWNCKNWNYEILDDLYLVLPMFVCAIDVCLIFGASYFCSSYICACYICPSYIWCLLFSFFIYLRILYLSFLYLVHPIFVLPKFGAFYFCVPINASSYNWFFQWPWLPMEWGGSEVIITHIYISYHFIRGNISSNTHGMISGIWV